MKKTLCLFLALATVLSSIAKDPFRDTYGKKRKGYIGGSIGVSIPVGPFGSSTSDDGGLATVGAHLNLVNFGYLFSEHVGITGSWFGGANPLDKDVVNVSDPWAYGGLLVGPLFSFPIGETVDWDLRPMIGYSVCTLPAMGYYQSQAGAAFAANLGTTFRFNVGEKVALLLNADFLYTKPEFKDMGLEQKISTLSLTFGVAYRLK